jgi:hypothetical protein
MVAFASLAYLPAAYVLKDGAPAGVAAVGDSRRNTLRLRNSDSPYFISSGVTSGMNHA